MLLLVAPSAVFPDIFLLNNKCNGIFSPGY